MKKTSIIHDQMKIADVIHLDYNLLPVINRFGIQLGFGEKLVAEICHEKNINTLFFLEVVNTFHDPGYFPKASLLKFPVSLLLDYLQKTHEFYLDVKVPELEKHIHQLISQTPGGGKNMQMIEKFFIDYKKELTDHIQHEEKKVYPYIKKLENALESSIDHEEDRLELQQYSISDFEDEHDNVEEKLYDLENIIIKYLPAPADSNLCNAILYQLFELEKDLTDHARLEDNILIPMVAAMEAKCRLKNQQPDRDEE